MSNTQKKNVPELRFPGFEGEWEEKKLGEVGTFTSGGTPLKSKSEYWNGDIPWITTGDIHNIKRENITNFITEKGLNESSAKLITNEAILIAMYGQGKTRGMSAILNFEATTNQACAIYQTNQNINFVFQYFQKLYKFLRSLSNEGSQKNLSLSLLKEITLNYPNEQEQKKIGVFFSKLDRQIELEEQKLELLQQQKKGYMQKIFSQELRFKDENGEDYPEWEERRFADIFKFHNKLRKPIKENLRVKGSYPYYGATGIIDYVDDFIFDGNYLLIGEDGANIITRSAPLVYLVNGKFWVNNHAHILSPLNGNIQYLYQVAELVNYEKYNTGTAQPKLNIQNLKIISVVISTNLEEQQKIGSFLSKLDRQIDLEEQKLELLQQRKKALLKLMFV
ncbi:restriction endonuclease subunit S [Staphylococcus aureus]|nr:restriction endonuclease subunit S [Staphylococcus aureus]